MLTLQFPFIHSFKDVVLYDDVCLYGHINWILVQAQQQPSSGLSQDSTLVRGGEARSKPGL